MTESATMSRVLVAGATGLLGRAVCVRARRHGCDVRALVRPTSRGANDLREFGCDIAVGDLKDANSLVDACRGIDVVVTTANSIQSRTPGDSLETVDLKGSLALLQAAMSAGVRRFIYTSVSPSLPSNNRFVRYKRQVESTVRVSGLEWTVLQPTAFMEIHAGPPAGWDLIRGRARVAGSGSAPVGYISIDDVAKFAVAATASDAAKNRNLPLAGPEPLSALAAVSIAERVTGRRFYVQRIPLPVLKSARVVAGLFNPHVDSLLGMIIGQESNDSALPEPAYDAFGLTAIPFSHYVEKSVAIRRGDAAGLSP